MKTILIVFILLQTILFAQIDTPQKVKLQLQWKYQFQFAGFIMAKELGYYKDVGLDVELIEYNNTNITKDLEENKIDFALTNSIVSYNNKKLRDVTLVATYFQRSPLILITQPEIKSVLDLKNKKIMISDDNRYNSSLSILLDYFNINSNNTSFIQPSFKISDFIEKRVDVITGFRSNELFLLDKKHIPYNVIDPIEYGFSTNAINLFVSHKKAKENPQQIKNFLSATKKGWEYALKNIDTVAKLIHLKYQPNKSIEHLIYEGKITKKLMLLNLYDIGTVNKEFVLKTYAQLVINHKLNKEQSPKNLIFKTSQKINTTKAIINLNHEEKEWIKYKLQEMNSTLAIYITIVMLLIIFFILIWSFRMKQEIKKRSIIQNELKMERDKNELYLDNAQVLIVALDTQARVTMLNKKAEELLEYTQEELLGKVWFEIGVLPKEIAKNVNGYFESIINSQVIDDGPYEHSLISRSGKEIILSFRNSLLFDEKGNVIGVLSSGTDITQRVEAEKALKHQAEHDFLTSLPNRVLFLDRLEQSIKHASRYKENIAVLFIDLDNFKDVNDSLGHAIGDVLLKIVSKELKNCLRQSDTVARFGGDEFAISIDHFNNIEIVISVVQTIMQAFKEPLQIQEHQIYVTLSLGISIYPQDGADSTTLIKNADAAMYKAKHNGRNNYQFYTMDMTQKALERITLETELRQSIQNNELEVYYQMQINSLDDSLTGMEALVRWNHPQKGLVPPDNFIPIAEKNGFIIKIDEWVMKEATSQFISWYKDGLDPGILSLNLSMARLEEDGFIQKTKEILQDSDIKPEWLSFEITETKLMQNPQNARKDLMELNNLGIKLSIDDFGTGYSSLAYLKKLPIDKLKIDRSFIKDLPDDLDDMEIVRTIISMATNLNLSVIAEGVETQEQKDFLQGSGCYDIQGYFYHKPSPASEVTKKLTEFN